MKDGTGPGPYFHVNCRGAAENDSGRLIIMHAPHGRHSHSIAKGDMIGHSGLGGQNYIAAKF